MPVYTRPDSALRSLGLWRFSKTAQQRTVSQGSGELVIKCYTGNISRITLLRGAAARPLALPKSKALHV